MPTREWSPLTTHFMVTSDSSPRTSPVDSIGEHHAASTSRDLCLALFQPGGRTVSPNYLVFRREIWGIVPENKRAWTSSDAWADSRSITKEIVNETGSPAYSFHPETLETIKRLDHDIATFYGIPYRHAIAGFWEHRNLYEWYGRSYATACAGPSFDINDIIAGSQTAGLPTIPIEELDAMETLYVRINEGQPNAGKVVRIGPGKAYVFPSGTTYNNVRNFLDDYEKKTVDARVTVPPTLAESTLYGVNDDLLRTLCDMYGAAYPFPTA